MHIPVSTDTLPSSATGIGVIIEIAGKTIHKDFPAEPNQDYLFQWDGKDAYGRVLTGSHPYKVSIRYYYPMVYMEPLDVYFSSFGKLPNFDEELMHRDAEQSYSYQNTYEGFLESPSESIPRKRSSRMEL